MKILDHDMLTASEYGKTRKMNKDELKWLIAFYKAELQTEKKLNKQRLIHLAIIMGLFLFGVIVSSVLRSMGIW